MEDCRGLLELFFQFVAEFLPTSLLWHQNYYRLHRCGAILHSPFLRDSPNVSVLVPAYVSVFVSLWCVSARVNIWLCHTTWQSWQSSPHRPFFLAGFSFLISSDYLLFVQALWMAAPLFMIIVYSVVFEISALLFLSLSSSSLPLLASSLRFSSSGPC